MHTRFRFRPLLGLLLLSGGGLRADTPADSTISYSAPEVVVTGTRIPQAFTRMPGLVSVLSRADIQALPGTRVADALEAVSGASFRSYGSGASVQTLSLRGLPPEHTLVLIDGERASSFQNGFFDFGLLPLANVERIEVAQGGLSALYGADAIGGAVNIITKRPPEKPSASASQTIGSAGYSAFELQGGAQAGPASMRLSLRREQSRGDYSFRFTDGTSTSDASRRGEDFRLSTADARVDLSAGSSLRFSVTGSYSDADRGSPGPFTDRLASGGARLYDKEGSVRLGGVYEASADLEVRLDGSASSSRETYTDPKLIHGEPTRTTTTGNAFILTPSVRWKGADGLILDAGGEFTQASIRGDELSTAHRSGRSAFASLEYKAFDEAGPVKDLLIVPAARYDSYSDVPGDVSPRLGLSFGLFDRQLLRLRSSVSKSYHVPTFNDMYWITGGNPNLRPERSVSFDAGLHSRLQLLGTLDLDLSAFNVSTRDRIVWVPGNSGLWSPRNYAAVRSRGVEGTVGWSGFGDILRLELNSTLLSTLKESADYPGDPTQGKELIYTPRQTTHLTGTLAWGGATIALRYTWSSYRFTTEVNDRFLPAYGVAGAALGYSLGAGPTTVRAKVELTNLLNEDYQVIALYPMPLRQVRGTLEVSL
jgi:vitamin B12 transporter